MFPIFRKEINSFFSSLIGYIVILVFLVAIGMFMWVFPGSNALDYGYASLDTLFFYAPWVFMFLIPAVTMRSFSEELKSGTIEQLSTRPVTDMQIILGKYFASVFLIVFALIPTLVYYYTVYTLGSPKGNLDSGAIWGSYIGLILLGGSFTAIGIFSSSLTSNQIISFIISVFFCFVFFTAFDSFSELSLFAGKVDTIIQSIGIDYHYQSISKGVVDTRDLFYFISIIVVFILFTKISLESRKW